MPLLTFTDAQIKDLVKRRHPEYADNIEHWKFLDACYVGGRKWLCEKNLFKFYKEGETEYKERLARSYRANHTKRVVDTVNEYLFKSRPQRAAGVPSLIKTFWENVDRRKMPIDRFMRDLDRWVSVFGRMYVVVDRPPQVAASRAEERPPYVYMVKPTHVLDIGYDEDGVMTWILIAEDYRDATDPTSSGKLQVRIRLWTRNEWYLFTPEDQKVVSAINSEPSYKLAASDEHNLGRVPVVCVHPIEGSTDYSSPAMIGDIAYMDRTVVNYGALLDEIIYEQTFSTMTLPSEALVPGTNEADALVAAAKNRILLYSATTPGAQPQFISPDASQAKLLIEAMQVLMKNIYAVVGADAGDANSQSMSKGREYASGVVRAFDHAGMENLLLTRAQALEAAEDAVMELVFAWMGQADTEIEKDWVRYPNSFDVRGLQMDLEIGLQLSEMAAPPVVQREHMKSTAEKLFPRKNDAEMQTLMAEIDGWEPKSEVEKANAARELDLDAEKNDIAQQGVEAQAEAAKRAAERPAPKSAS